MRLLLQKFLTRDDALGVWCATDLVLLPRLMRRRMTHTECVRSSVARFGGRIVCSPPETTARSISASGFSGSHSAPSYITLERIACLCTHRIIFYLNDLHVFGNSTASFGSFPKAWASVAPGAKGTVICRRLVLSYAEEATTHGHGVRTRQ